MAKYRKNMTKTGLVVSLILNMQTVMGVLKSAVV